MPIHSPGRALLLGAALLPLYAMASSHREAPAIAGMPQVDGSDFYMFRSYEPGRSGYVTFIANYAPLQDPAGGPNFYNLATNTSYQIHISNNGAATDSMKISFVFQTSVKGLAVNAGGKKIEVPLENIGQVNLAGTDVNVLQSYTVEVAGNGKNAFGENLATGGTQFWKPVDNIGNKSIPDYAAYAANFMYPIALPGCATPGRVFVGQRKEGFVVNLGELFDLVNLNPAGPRNAEPNTLYDKNVTSLVIELPISCLTTSANPVIGAYTTADLITRPNTSSPCCGRTTSTRSW